MSFRIGLDFGTTNSALAIVDDNNRCSLVTFPTYNEYKQEAETFRSVLYFNKEKRHKTGRYIPTAGPTVIHDYLENLCEGRFIQSIKSFLAHHSFTKTTIFTKQFSLENLISIIISQIKKRAEDHLGQQIERVVIGRPVHFVGAENDADNSFALSRLYQAVIEAGFKDVTFEYEPVAAARQYARRLKNKEIVLIGDFGGGTSDFSLLEVGPQHAEVIGNDGVGIAGDTFDSRIIEHLVAPYLGYGSQYRSINKVLEVPAWIFKRLGTWRDVSFMKDPKTLRLLHEISVQALEKIKIDSLITLIEEDLAFQLYTAVERTKMVLSSNENAPFSCTIGEQHISTTVSRSEFTSWIKPDLDKMSECIDRLLSNTGLASGKVTSVFLTGGSAFVPAVRDLFRSRFGQNALKGGEELTSVAQGLTMSDLSSKNSR